MSLSKSLEGRKTSVIRESGVKEESKGKRERKKDEMEARDFPASGSNSRFTVFASGRTTVEGGRKIEGWDM